MELLFLFALGVIVFLLVYGGMAVSGIVPLSGSYVHMLWALVFACWIVGLVNRFVLGW